MTDTMTRAVHDAGIAISLVRCGGVARRICHEQHDLSGDAAAALAMSIASTLLLATRLKGSGLLTWTVSTEGAFTQHRVDAMGLGMVRAMVSPSTHERLAERGPGESLFGPGRVVVTRQLEGQQQSYSSALALEEGEDNVPAMANAVLRRSDQVNARILFHIEPELQQVVACYIERLPGDTPVPMPATLPALLSDADAVLPDCDDDEALLRELIGDDEVKVLHRYGVSFHCPCSRERFQATLAGFAKEELVQLQEDGVITATCDFCRSSYPIPLDDLL